MNTGAEIVVAEWRLSLWWRADELTVMSKAVEWKQSPCLFLGVVQVCCNCGVCRCCVETVSTLALWCTDVFEYDVYSFLHSVAIHTTLPTHLSDL
jgi:hypothetical protein